ncbi:MAG: molybdopterin-binding protein [Acidobacteriales bacterium]|nr:molybdopterin-binding protein [Terriglobales bacterium]
MSAPEPKTPPKRDHKWSAMNRRELLKISPVLLLGAFAFEKFQKPLLDAGVDFSDWATDKLFRGHHLAPTFADSELTPLEKFPYNGYDVIEPEFDLDAWTLTVAGAVDKPGEYTLAQIKALPKINQNTRHVCVEGWDVIGNYGGTRISDLLAAVGADTKLKFVSFECADDYYESIDMASALHPQSLLCYEMYGKPLDRGHGAPLRLQVPTKLGYKQAKYITKLEVTNVLQAGKNGYWEDQGYSWFAGM